MKQVLVRSGAIVVEEVPAPTPGPKEILVRVAYSCVSAGTELAGLRASALPLYRRALKQPEHVRRALEMIRDQGLARTWERVTGKLAAGSATGYSVAGEVLDVGEQVEGFARCDRVACAGAGIANHAELVSAPVNLVNGSFEADTVVDFNLPWPYCQYSGLTDQPKGNQHPSGWTFYSPASGQPLPWYGAAHGGFQDWQGENSPSDSWAGFGQAVRLTMAAFMQANPEQAKKNGLTEATFKAEADRRISQYVENFYQMSGNVMSSNPIEEDAARQCALGNPAACNH